jgi:hypothetical protein
MPFTAREVAYLRSRSPGRPAVIGDAGFRQCRTAGALLAREGGQR